MSLGRRMVLTLPLAEGRNTEKDGHWSRRAKAKKAYFQKCDNLQLLGKVPGPPPRAFGRAAITVVMRVWNENDGDNAMARLKSTCDWLKSRGYIVDDRLRHLRWNGQPEQVIDRGPSCGTVVITLTEILDF